MLVLLARGARALNPLTSPGQPAVPELTWDAKYSPDAFPCSRIVPRDL